MLSRPECADTPIFDGPLRPHGDQYAPTHIVGAVNVRRFRELLKQAREGKALRTGKLGRPALSKLTAGTGPKPVNPSTIKNIEDGKSADPGIATISRIVEAMGLPLSLFFARIEGQTDSDLPAWVIEGRTARPLEEGVPHGGGRPTVPLSAPALLAAGEAFLETGTRLIDAATGGKVKPSRRATPRVRRKKPGKGKRGGATG